MSGDPHALPDEKEGWSVPLPAHIPPPTWWPSATALAVVLILFGVVTTPVFSLVGLLGFIVSLGGWIGEMRHD